MASILADAVLDNGLAYLHTNADKIYICSADPTTYTEAISTYALGNKNFGAGNAFGVPAAGSPNGRASVSPAITDGSVTANGTAAKWAAVYSGGTALLANGALSGSQAVTSGSTFTLGAVTIRIPNQ